jgi:NDP-sugar pyrophosphorylase family protein
MRASDFFDIPSNWSFAQHFSNDEAPWEWLTKIGYALESLDWQKLQAQSLPVSEISPTLFVSGSVFIHPTVKLPPYGCIQGPAYIGANTELRPGVYIRGNVIVGENCVLGNSCEYKNCLLFNNVQTPHFNYIGDSILGSHSHLGAGAILSNFRLDGQNIKVKTGSEVIPTNLRKFGAVLGDHAQVGCNAVLQPGTVLGRNAIVYPVQSFSGFLPSGDRARS